MTISSDFSYIENIELPDDFTLAERIYYQLAYIEQEARREIKYGYLGDSDDEWKHHPLAKMYRKLMVQWWTLPNSDIYKALQHSPDKRWGSLPQIQKRLLTSKGMLK